MSARVLTPEKPFPVSGILDIVSGMCSSRSILEAHTIHIIVYVRYAWFEATLEMDD